MLNIDQWNEKNDPHFLKRSVLACDLDDTLTDRGTLNSTIIKELEKLQNKGYLVILVTGRPAGWADTLVRLLPFDAVICENGAAIYYWEKSKLERSEGEGPRQIFWHPGNVYSTKEPENTKEKLAQAEIEILQAFPQCRVASDQRFRLYDLAIDFAEEIVPPLNFLEAEKIKDHFEKLGATAKVSSIHVNGWWGEFSKSSALQYVAEQLFSFSIEENLIYMGDSPNDAPLFELADCSIGVSNIKEFPKEIDFHKPKYLTQNPRYQGVIEVIEKILIQQSGDHSAL